MSAIPACLVAIRPGSPASYLPLAQCVARGSAHPAFPKSIPAPWQLVR